MELLFKRVGELLAQGNVVLLSGSCRDPLRFRMVDLKSVQCVWVCFSPVMFSYMGHTGTGELNLTRVVVLPRRVRGRVLKCLQGTQYRGDHGIQAGKEAA